MFSFDGTLLPRALVESLRWTGTYHFSQIMKDEYTCENEHEDTATPKGFSILTSGRTNQDFCEFRENTGPFAHKTWKKNLIPIAKYLGKVLLRTTNDTSLILTSTHHPPRNKEVTMATVGDPPDGSEDAGDSGNSRRAAKAGSNDVSFNYFCIHFGE